MKDWKKLLISPDTLIINALKIIDAGSAKIVFAVDSEETLLGSVTDGDIRRAILRGVSLNQPVSDAMRKDPRYLKAGQKTEEILDLMKKAKINQVPLVDDNKKIVGVEILKDLVQAEEKDNWVVLMAGGVGQRLKPLTNDCPKPLLRVGSKPILQTILEEFISQGFKKFFISVNYKEEMVKEHFGNGAEWGIEIEYLCENKPLGTAGALNLLSSKPSKPLIVMNGDLLTKVNFHHLIDFHEEHQSKATMCVREYDLQVPFGVVNLDDSHISSIDEKPRQQLFVNAGIYVLNPEVLDEIKEDESTDMPELFNQLVQLNKKSVSAFPVREYWVDIGRMDDLDRAHGEYASVFQ